MQILKADTQSVIMLGPAVDIADGYTLISTLVTAMDAASGIRISKNGGAWADRAATVVTTVYDEGWYQVTLKSGDLDTIGTLDVMYEDATTCQPMFTKLQVVPAGVYDAMFSGTGTWLTNLSTSALGIITGTAVTGTLTTTSFTTSLTTGYATSELVNRTIIFYGSASNAGCAGVITSSTSGGLIGIIGAIATAPANTDTFVIV